MNALKDMTQAKWSALSIAERDAIRDNSGLTPQLVGLEGWRVQVVDVAGGQWRRFIVGKSTGWRPCHLEIKRRSSSGGLPAEKSYHSVGAVEKVR